MFDSHPGCLFNLNTLYLSGKRYHAMLKMWQWNRMKSSCRSSGVICMRRFSYERPQQYGYSAATLLPDLICIENENDILKLKMFRCNEALGIIKSRWFKLRWRVATSVSPCSNEVEMTAYALLTYSHRQDIGSAIPIIKWLTSKQNGRGGFSSTQVEFQ